MKPSVQPDFARLFGAVPECILVVAPETHEVVAATTAYLEATRTRACDLVGRSIAEVCPEDEEDAQPAGEHRLLASLRRVASLKAEDAMGVQRRLIRLPDGTFEARFWSRLNRPVLDDAGDVAFILHRVEDVTSLVCEGQEAVRDPGAEVGDTPGARDALLQSCRFRQALASSQRCEVRMRVAERLLGLGAWEYNVRTRRLAWSAQVHAIYGVPADRPAPDLEGYFALVHPDDQASSRAIYEAFSASDARTLEFEHRVVGRDGEVKHVRGIGERSIARYGESDDLVVGYVQDMTSLVEVRNQLSQAEQLLRLAGQKAHLGGWRVELAAQVMLWTPGTAAIHGFPRDYMPADVREALSYFAPAYRGMVREAVERCAADAEEFDIVCRLDVPKERRPWVRVIGVPELDESGAIVAVQGGFQDISMLHEAQMRATKAERDRLNVLESISDAFLVLDTEWKFQYLNPRAVDLVEMTPEALLGRSVWEIFPEATGTEYFRAYHHAMETQQTVRFQAFFPPSSRWLDVSAYPIPEGLAVYLRDVTEERQHLERLRLIEACLSRQNDLVVITEADAIDGPEGPRIVYVNDAFERLTGYTKSEVIGRTPRILQGAGTSREELDRIREALRNQEPIRCELLNYAKTGEPYWLELEITPLFDEAGQCTHFVAVERDVTERKTRDEELRQAQERFHLISRATSDVIWDWDLRSDRLWWNNAMSEVFGYSRSEVEPDSTSWTSRIHLEDKERVLRSVRDVIAGKEERWGSEYRFLKSNGESADVVDRGFVIRDDTKAAVRMVGSMLDITGRKQMEQQLRESQKLEAVGHLTGGVAHDFNNLLTVIMGNAEMLAELVTDPPLRSMAEMTVSAARRGAELTSRLLAFARRKPLDPRATDINRLIDDMRGLIRRTLPVSIEIQFVLEPELGTVAIDASELDTALLNLVFNARDAMPGGGKLTLETANVVLDSDYADRHIDVAAGDYVMVCVSDTGVGMSAATARRAFEPFFTTKAVGKGSGLGLSMAYGFTKQSGGHIKIYSEEGEGTAIKLYFPRVRDAQESRVLAAAQSVVVGGSEHILIAEDDDLVREHLQSLLRAMGYRVSAVSSGPEALVVLQASDDIALLLTDIIMPGGMNGRQLADRALVTSPGLKILYMSGYTEDSIVHHGRLDPGVALLNKPYSRLQLATKVRQVLDNTPSLAP